MLMTKEKACKILHLDKDANEVDIQISYVLLASKNHPYQKSSSLDTTKVFKEVSIAYKRLQQPEDNDWVEQFNSMDLFVSVNGGPPDDSEDDTDYDGDDYYNDEDDHDFYGYCCPFCEEKFLYFDPEQYQERIKNSEKMAANLLEEEFREKKKAGSRKKRKLRRRKKRKQPKEKHSNGAEENLSSDKHQDCVLNSLSQARKPLREMSNRKAIMPPTEHPKPNDEDNNHKTKCGNKLPLKTAVESFDRISEATGCNSENVAPSKKSSNKNKSKWIPNGEVISSQNRFELLNSNKASENMDVSESKNAQCKKADHQTTEKGKNPQVITLQTQQNVFNISRQFAYQGNQLAVSEEYEEAVRLFSRAISLLPSDCRYYGNRSYCYDRLEKYEEALEDAEIAISLSPSWTKGYFRKGRALAGLKRYAEAEQAYEEVLKLDGSCVDTQQHLLEVRMAHLMDMGFSKEQCQLALNEKETLQQALDYLLTTALSSTELKDVYTSGEESGKCEKKVIKETGPLAKKSPESCEIKSLWVGNVSPPITEFALEEYFVWFGPIESVKVLYNRRCAFVNFTAAHAARRALKSASVIEIYGLLLPIRLPEKFASQEQDKQLLSNRVECRFWRSTGCVFGSACHYQHIPENKGIDSSLLERTPYQSVSYL